VESLVAAHIVGCSLHLESFLGLTQQVLIKWTYDRSFISTVSSNRYKTKPPHTNQAFTTESYGEIIVSYGNLRNIFLQRKSKDYK
jgi:hypothetical protein